MSSIEQIDKNVSAYMAGLISYEAFSVLQRAEWHRLESCPASKTRVLRTIRRRLNVAAKK